MTVSAGAFVLICLAGGLGSMLRASLSAALTRAMHPAGAIFAINALGSFLIGVALGLVFGAFEIAAPGETPRGFLLFAVGVLGGFTTVSTYALQLHELWAAGRARAAALVAVGSVVICPLLALMGALMVIG